MNLRLESVKAGYPGGFSLDGVSLTAAPGSLVGIVGPNGSGKSTLLKVIARTLRPRAGRVWLDDRELADLRPRELARCLAVAPQTTPPLSMTVEAFVRLGRIPHFEPFQFLDNGRDREVAERVMRLTECWPFRTHPMSAISGGERQLAVIARALAQEPRLLLLDEPTAHLDIAHQVRVLDLIRRLNRELALTVLMVIHDLNAACDYCDELVLMHAGRVRLDGPPETVMDYRVLEEVYRTVLVVGRNDLSGKPYVFTVSEDDRRRAAEAIAAKDAGKGAADAAG